jgi:hypothetical protein
LVQKYKGMCIKREWARARSHTITRNGDHTPPNMSRFGRSEKTRLIGNVGSDKSPIQFSESMFEESVIRFVIQDDKDDNTTRSSFKNILTKEKFKTIQIKRNCYFTSDSRRRHEEDSARNE